MGRPGKYSPELRKRAVRIVREHTPDYPSQRGRDPIRCRETRLPRVPGTERAAGPPSQAEINRIFAAATQDPLLLVLGTLVALRVSNPGRESQKRWDDESVASWVGSQGFGTVSGMGERVAMCHPLAKAGRISVVAA